MIIKKKRITFVSGCYNEEGNLEELVQRVFRVADKFDQYDFEYIIIDNASVDRSVKILCGLIKIEPRLRAIVNTRNFGHIRSPYYGMLQASGDAVIYLASDLQDPPELIEMFINKWEAGYKVVAAIKEESAESALFFFVRKLYYEIVSRLADVDLLKNFTGFGLYDRVVMDQLRAWEDPYPYHRGMISELGYDIAKVPFKQPLRKRGFTKNNIFTLYDIAMLGLTSHTKVPLRLATMMGFALSIVFFVIGLVYLFYKLFFWREFSLGLAPLVVGLFFFGSIQLFFIGVLGEYIGSIYTKIAKRPLVVEKERINF